MTTCGSKDEQLRANPQRHGPARGDHVRGDHRRRDHAPVVGPLALALLVEVTAVLLAVAFGLPAPAIAGVAVTVAALTAIVARRTVSSLVAGAGLAVAQPYGPGEQIRMFVPALNSVEDAEIVRVGAANTTLLTTRGIVLVPNAHMLRGADPT